MSPQSQSFVKQIYKDCLAVYLWKCETNRHLNYISQRFCFVSFLSHVCCFSLHSSDLLLMLYMYISDSCQENVCKMYQVEIMSFFSFSFCLLILIDILHVLTATESLNQHLTSRSYSGIYLGTCFFHIFDKIYQMFMIFKGKLK